MEQLSEPRFTADQSVSVTILGPENLRCAAKVKDTSGRGLGLQLPLPDCMLLGEVAFCRAAQNGYLVRVEMQQALNGLRELAAAVSAFQDDPVRE